MMNKNISEEVRKVMERLKGSTQPDLQPILKQGFQDIKEALSKVRINIPEIGAPEVTVNVPDITVPEIKVPATVVNFDASRIRIPDIKMPEEMSIRGFVSLLGYDRGLLSNPLPVQLRDAKGKPIELGGNSSYAISGGGGGIVTIGGALVTVGVVTINPDGTPVYGGTSGGGLTDAELRASSVPVEQASGSMWSVSVKEIFGSTATDIINPDGRIKVELPTGSSGLTDAELRAAHLDVQQVSGSVDSVSVVTITDIFSTTSASTVVNPDNRVRVELPAGASGLTDTELRATAVPISQVSGANWSTEVTNTVTVDGSGVTQPVSATNLDIRDLANASDSVSSYQISGHIYSVFATNPVDQGDSATALRVVIAGNSSASVFATNPVAQGDAATALRVVIAGNSDASVSATQVGTWNIATVTTVTGITNTVAAVNVDSTGVQYSGSNPLPTYLVAGSGNSTISVGDIASGTADTGSAPVKVGGIARTANPTAEAAGDRIAFTADDLGRQVVRNIQVRDLIQTAYVSVTNGTETTLRAAVSGAFLDLIMIVGSNNSDAAVSVDIRPVTAGSIINTLRIPANSTAGWTPPVPWPQSEQGNNWTVDGPDETGRTLTFSALFSQEV